ncbi:hypothetical protein [Novosphingobium resinovorum]|uniref:Uncharacterized protein n=1 Tax=Novosphingobium resinovorum TaxID=158500 RepID=A0A1D8A365_9SPHN|nr:hypothetical protein [Novosphingobium resinovorum]AOR76549.1 hypothetical protein BES08_07165 [Novosphingobium resinovorum]
MSEDPSVAYQALNLARQNARDIEKHEDICAERYQGIHDAIDEIKGVLWKAGGGAFTVILGVLGFLLVQQLNANGKLHDENQSEIRRLQQQLNDERANRVIQVTPQKEVYVDN